MNLPLLHDTQFWPWLAGPLIICLLIWLRLPRHRERVRTAPMQGDPIKPQIRTAIPGFVRGSLFPAEQILAAFSASLFDQHRKYNFSPDKFVLTDQRIIYYQSAFIHKSMGEMPYRMISGVHYNKGVVHGTIVLHGADFALTLSRIGNQDAAFAERVIAGCIAGRQFRAV